MEQEIEIIDAAELGRRWAMPTSWIREYCRSRCETPIPHLIMGRYRRFRFGSPELNQWLEKRLSKAAR